MSDIAGTDRARSDLMEASPAMSADMVPAGKMSAAMSPTMEMGVTAAVSTMTAATMSPMATAVTAAAATRKCSAGQRGYHRGNGKYPG